MRGARRILRGAPRGIKPGNAVASPCGPYLWPDKMVIVSALGALNCLVVMPGACGGKLHVPGILIFLAGAFGNTPRLKAGEGVSSEKFLQPNAFERISSEKFLQPNAFERISSEKFLQPNAFERISSEKFLQPNAFERIYSEKFLQKRAVGENYSRKRLQKRSSVKITQGNASKLKDAAKVFEEKHKAFDAAPVILPFRRLPGAEQARRQALTQR